MRRVRQPVFCQALIATQRAGCRVTATRRTKQRINTPPPPFTSRSLLTILTTESLLPFIDIRLSRCRYCRPRRERSQNCGTSWLPLWSVRFSFSPLSFLLLSKVHTCISVQALALHADHLHEMCSVVSSLLVFQASTTGLEVDYEQYLSNHVCHSLAVSLARRALFSVYTSTSAHSHASDSLKLT